LPSEPIIDLFANVIRGEAVARMDPVLEPITPSLNGIEVAIGELAPLLFYLPFGLLPVFLNLVPVHFSLLRQCQEGLLGVRVCPRFHGANRPKPYFFVGISAALDGRREGALSEAPPAAVCIRSGHRVPSVRAARLRSMDRRRRRPDRGTQSKKGWPADHR
jgi:hypothetical protein